MSKIDRSRTYVYRARRISMLTAGVSPTQYQRAHPDAILFQPTATPSIATMERWSESGIAKALDGCRVELDGACPHGLPSWVRHLGMVNPMVNPIVHAKGTARWYSHDTHTGWKKSQTALTRRRKALSGHGGNALAAARGLQALSNVTRDSVTKRLAALDARYFFRLHRGGADNPTSTYRRGNTHAKSAGRRYRLKLDV